LTYSSRISPKELICSGLLNRAISHTEQELPNYRKGQYGRRASCN
jgi:hypothetical protein